MHKLSSHRDLSLDKNSIYKVNNKWGTRAREHVNPNKVQKHWMEHPVSLKSINKAVSGDENTNLFQFIKNKFPDGFSKALVLGSGAGGLERTLILNGTIKKCIAYDISKSAVELAQEKAKENNIDHQIEYKIEDLNKIRLPSNEYDVIFGWHSIHHIEDLEGLFTQIKTSLKDTGIFIVNEYVGSSRYQFSDKQIELMNWILELLPVKYKTSVVDGKIRGPLYREKPEVIALDDPTESIRSGEILDLLNKYFVPVFRRDYGGTLMQFSMDTIVGNFNPKDEKDVLLLRFLCEFEKLLIKENVITSDYSFLILKKK